MAAGPSCVAEDCGTRDIPMEQQVFDGSGRQVLPLRSADELADPHVGRYQSQLRPQPTRLISYFDSEVHARDGDEPGTKRTSKGTDTKFASSVMGPCSNGRARKTTATESPADMPVNGTTPVQFPSQRTVDSTLCQTPDVIHVQWRTKQRA